MRTKQSILPHLGPDRVSTSSRLSFIPSSYDPSLWTSYVSLIDDTERKKETHKLESHYRTLNWITPQLRDKLVCLFPSTSEDINTVNNNQRNVVQFKKNLETFCVPGRFFASPDQCQQALKILCSKWSVNVAYQHNSILCHYSKPDTIKLHPDPSKRHKPRALSLCECPFSIKCYILQSRIGLI